MMRVMVVRGEEEGGEGEEEEGEEGVVVKYLANGDEGIVQVI